MVAFDTMRSFLFVPANRPERYAKAAAAGADAVILDLEDAVPADAKDEALEALTTDFSERRRRWRNTKASSCRTAAHAVINRCQKPQA